MIHHRMENLLLPIPILKSMHKIKGILWVAFGAISYGVLATFVKVANNNGAHTGVLTFVQFLVGAAFLSVFVLMQNKKTIPSQKPDAKSRIKLIIGGTSLGLTSTFYYLSIQYIPVSMGIILLMQTIWMGILLEFFIAPKNVTKLKLLAGLITIIGTLLATNIFAESFDLNITGLIYGLLAALSYTATLYVSNHVANHLLPMTRSMYLVLGGLLATVLYWNVEIITFFDFETLWKWGIFLAIFGTIIPPIAFTKGLPVIGTGLGSILSALEIPVSILSAHFVLGEVVSPIQWVGILIILGSIVLINTKTRMLE